MGIIYKEIVRHRKVSSVRGFIMLVACILTVNILVNSTHYSSEYNIALEILLIAGGLLAIPILKSIVHVAYTQRICYAYKLIDKELIFERNIGKSRKVILDIDMEDVEVFLPAMEAKDIKGSRTYKFLCRPSKENIYCCVVRERDEKVKVYFQPSSELIRKLKLVMGDNPNISKA